MVIRGTLVYSVSYSLKGSPEYHFRQVCIGGAEAEAYRTTFRDVVKIVAIAEGTTEDRIIIRGLTLVLNRSDPSAL